MRLRLARLLPCLLVLTLPCLASAKELPTLTMSRSVAEILAVSNPLLAQVPQSSQLLLSPAAGFTSATASTVCSSTLGCDVRRSPVLRVFVWSAAGSVATVKIKTRPAATVTGVSVPWFAAAVITNPTGPDGSGIAGEYYNGTRTGFITCEVTAYTSGNIFCLLETWPE